LNSDGLIGPLTTVIGSNGSTQLTKVGNHLYLYDSNLSGPSLKFFGAGAMADTYGAWTPIGAEQTASGYEIAWKNGSADQYTVWNTDSSGNYVSNIGVVSGASVAFESVEPSFHQDLNGDGQTGLVMDGHLGGQTLIAGAGPTTLIGGPSDILNAGAGADTFVFPEFWIKHDQRFCRGHGRDPI
jgi:Tryptophan-rich Synechocystis species C-terminal domain